MFWDNNYNPHETHRLYVCGEERGAVQPRLTMHVEVSDPRDQDKQNMFQCLVEGDIGRETVSWSVMHTNDNDPGTCTTITSCPASCWLVEVRQARPLF